MPMARSFGKDQLATKETVHTQPAVAGREISITKEARCTRLQLIQTRYQRRPLGSRERSPTMSDEVVLETKLTSTTKRAVDLWKN
jgi:hypothetical protein